MSLFNDEPIEVDGGLVLRDYHAVTGGALTPEAVQHQLRLAIGFVQSGPWWLADLCLACEGHPALEAVRDAVMEEAGFAHQTMLNMISVAKNVPLSRRRERVGFTFHADVQALTPSEQTYFLEKVETEGWKRAKLRQEIQNAKRRKVIQGRAHVEGTYRVTLADPPWPYQRSQPSGSSAASHYQTMTIEQILAWAEGLRAQTTPDAVLLLWTTAPWLLLNPGPRDVIEAAGFAYKTNIVWDKVLPGGGHYVDTRHEHLLIATTGSGVPDIEGHPSFDSIQTIRKGEHSEKPAAFYDLIESLWSGPYVEHFARNTRPGWDSVGNDPALAE